MERTGFKVEKTKSRNPYKITDTVTVLENKVFEEKEPKRWTKKMMRSFEQSQKGDWVKGDINNFWNL